MKMKPYLYCLFLLFFCQAAIGQFYYKDIILTQQAVDKWKIYQHNNVKLVNILSYEANDQPVEGFTCEEKMSPDYSEITTHTHSTFSPESNLVCYYDKNGLLKKSVDVSDRLTSTTEYDFDSQGHVISITNSSAASDTSQPDVEQHQWEYDSQGNPLGMLKIKNTKDTTFIRFVKEEKGNIAEEHATRNKINLPVIYYYYDDSNRLTDIVRYNENAKRLLPDYIFEYNSEGYLSVLLSITEDSKDYQKWYYQYDDKGLREKESCFNKQKQLMGRIEYRYSFKK